MEKEREAGTKERKGKERKRKEREKGERQEPGSLSTRSWCCGWLLGVDTGCGALGVGAGKVNKIALIQMEKEKERGPGLGCLGREGGVGEGGVPFPRISTHPVKHHDSSNRSYIPSIMSRYHMFHITIAHGPTWDYRRVLKKG